MFLKDSVILHSSLDPLPQLAACNWIYKLNSFDDLLASIVQSDPEEYVVQHRAMSRNRHRKIGSDDDRSFGDIHTSTGRLDTPGLEILCHIRLMFTEGFAIHEALERRFGSDEELVTPAHLEGRCQTSHEALRIRLVRSGDFW